MPKLFDKPATRLVLGRARFAKISAVEGIYLSSEMLKDLLDFDRQGLTAAERRKRIAKKYGRRD